MPNGEIESHLFASAESCYVDSRTDEGAGFENAEDDLDGDEGLEALGCELTDSRNAPRRKTLWSRLSEHYQDICSVAIHLMEA